MFVSRLSAGFWAACARPDITGNVLGVYSIDIAEFTGLDVTNLTEVTFAFGNGGIFGVDVQFNDFAIVPTPSAAGLVGLAGLYASRCRR